jgi:hypothetical protein
MNEIDQSFDESEFIVFPVCVDVGSAHFFKHLLRDSRLCY